VYFSCTAQLADYPLSGSLSHVLWISRLQVLSHVLWISRLQVLSHVLWISRLQVLSHVLWISRLQVLSYVLWISIVKKQIALYDNVNLKERKMA
jgi:DNA-binding CsgD family transcriptional regulator